MKEVKREDITNAKKMRINIPVKTTREKFYNEMMILLRPLFEGYLGLKKGGKEKLYDSELKVISYLLYYYDEYKDIEKGDKRWKVIFDLEMRARMRSKCNMSVAVFDNCIYRLKQKGVIEVFKDEKGIKHSRLKSFFNIGPVEDDVEILFHFMIEKKKQKDEY